MNLPTAEDVRRHPGLRRVRDAIVGMENMEGGDAATRDIALRLDFGRLRCTTMANATMNPRGVEHALSVLTYWLVSPVQQSPRLFDTVRRLFELPAGAADRHIDAQQLLALLPQ